MMLENLKQHYVKTQWTFVSNFQNLFDSMILLSDLIQQPPPSDLWVWSNKNYICAVPSSWGINLSSSNASSIRRDIFGSWLLKSCCVHSATYDWIYKESVFHVTPKYWRYRSAIVCLFKKYNYLNVKLG